MFEREKLSHIVAAALLIVAGQVIAVAEYFGIPQRIHAADQKTACTQEAKSCPDGSVVGRTRPNCEFAECQTLSVGQSDISSWQTYRNEQYGFEIQYPPMYSGDKVIQFSAGEEMDESLALGTYEAPVKGIVIGPLLFTPINNKALKEKIEVILGWKREIISRDLRDIENNIEGPPPIECEAIALPEASASVELIYCTGEGGSTLEASIKGDTQHFYVEDRTRVGFVKEMLSTFKFIK